MIALALAWIILYRAAVVLGDLLLRALGAPPPATQPDADHWFLTFWTGLLALASATLAVTLVAPAPYAAPLLLFALFPRAAQTPLKPPRHFWFIAAAMTYTASSPVRLYDTALYHQPAIEWMSAEGLTPGLALLHFRFGFSSSWLALTSLFNTGVLIHRTGPLITALALIAVLTQWMSLYRQNNTNASRFYLAGLPLLLLFYFLDSALVSPSPNLAAALAVFCGLWLLLRSPAHPASLALAAGALAIKLSAAPLAAIALLRAPRRAFLFFALVLPFLLANYQTTGCPLFPATLACTGGPSALPLTQVREVAFETLNWARYAGFYPRDAAYFSLGWLPRNLAVPRNALVAALVLASLITLIARRRLTLPIAAAALGSLYVYAAAPDPRFGAAFLLALTALALPPIPWPPIPHRTLLAVLALVLTAGAFLGERLSHWNSPDPRYAFSITRLLLPAEAWVPESATTALINGIPIHRPHATDRCGAHPQPCTPYPVPPTLHRTGRAWAR